MLLRGGQQKIEYGILFRLSFSHSLKTDICSFVPSILKLIDGNPDGSIYNYFITLKQIKERGYICSHNTKFISTLPPSTHTQMTESPKRAFSFENVMSDFTAIDPSV